jgi:hypothetical protein
MSGGNANTSKNYFLSRTAFIEILLHKPCPSLTKNAKKHNLDRAKRP